MTTESFQRATVLKHTFEPRNLASFQECRQQTGSLVNACTVDVTLLKKTEALLYPLQHLFFFTILTHPSRRERLAAKRISLCLLALLDRGNTLHPYRCLSKRTESLFNSSFPLRSLAYSRGLNVGVSLVGDSAEDTARLIQVAMLSEVPNCPPSSTRISSSRILTMP